MRQAILGALIGGVFVYGMNMLCPPVNSRGWGANWDNTPIKLNKAELSADYIDISMPSMRAEIQIMSDIDWKSWKQKNGVGSAVTGNTSMEIGKCVVRIPAYRVVVWPKIGLLTFEAASDSDNLGHELFHCAAGPWHPSWDVIQNDVRARIWPTPPSPILEITPEPKDH